MKVYEATYEYYSEKEVKRTVEYVEAENIKIVTDEMFAHCHEYEFELVQVREVLTISRRLNGEDDKI